MWIALYEPSRDYSYAVNFPNEGEICLIMKPAMKYHPKSRPGPYHPTNSESFREKKTMSSIGLAVFKYKLESDPDHFSASEVSL